MRTHEQCGAHGYFSVKPMFSVQPPKILSGGSHVLRADLEHDELTVTADGVAVWRGAVGRQIEDMSGPAGFRTDNARFEFEFLAAGSMSSTGSTRAPSGLTHCGASPGD